tara:strand:+ start:987 stop:1805 length:819 start_codon:yes stop_codon:yes gene_type:complete
MDLIDKYFELVGYSIDSQIMNYMGFDNKQKDEVARRISYSLGDDGINNLMKDKVKGIIKISSGGYDLRIKITDWEVYENTERHTGLKSLEIDDINVLIDPKSTVELLGNGVTYEFGDLYTYTNMDTLNIMYGSEDNPIDEDSIDEMGYEVQEAIKDWLYDNVYPLTGVDFESINPRNGGKNFDLNEQIEGLDIRKFALYADLFEPLYKAFENDEMEYTYRELSKKIHGNKQHILDYFYNFIKQNKEYLNSKTNVVESLIRINNLMTDKPKKN